MTRGMSPQGRPYQYPRRRGNSGFVFFMLLLALAVAAVFAIGFLAPNRLSAPQEQILGLLHGGIVDVQAQTAVECQRQADGGVPQAITRFTRTLTYADGTSLIVTFNSSPAHTTLKCS